MERFADSRTPDQSGHDKVPGSTSDASAGTSDASAGTSGASQSPSDGAVAAEPARDITLREAQEMVDRWIRTVGVRYFSPLTNMAVLTEEVGEVARIMARTYGDQSFKAGEKNSLADELADVLWVVMAIANQTGTDLTEALAANIAKKTRRDADRHRNNPALRVPPAD